MNNSVYSDAGRRLSSFPLTGYHHRTPGIRHRVMKAIEQLGAKTLSFVRHLGRAALFLFAALLRSGTVLRRPRLMIRQMYFSGVLSIVIIAVSGLFVGMVLGLQAYTQLAKFKSADILDYMVAAAMLQIGRASCRERVSISVVGES